MRFKIDYNPKNQQWEVKDDLCCNQVVGNHLNARNAQAQREYEEALWNRFSSDPQEMSLQYWCPFYRLDKGMQFIACTNDGGPDQLQISEVTPLIPKIDAVVNPIQLPKQASGRLGRETLSKRRYTSKALSFRRILRHARQAS